MSVADWSTNPASNTSIDGVNIAEGCPAANMNDSVRRVMASVRVMYDGLPNVSGLMPKSGGVFLTNPTLTGAGGYLYNASASSTGGKITIQALGGAAPSGPQNGDLWGEY